MQQVTSPSSPPTVTRLIDRDGRAYALRGWLDFLDWARANDALVRDVDAIARREGYSAEDRERVLLHAMVLSRSEERDRGPVTDRQ